MVGLGRVERLIDALFGCRPSLAAWHHPWLTYPPHVNIHLSTHTHTQPLRGGAVPRAGGDLPQDHRGPAPWGSAFLFGVATHTYGWLDLSSLRAWNGWMYRRFVLHPPPISPPPNLNPHNTQTPPKHQNQNKHRSFSTCTSRTARGSSRASGYPARACPPCPSPSSSPSSAA